MDHYLGWVESIEPQRQDGLRFKWGTLRSKLAGESFWLDVVRARAVGEGIIEMAQERGPVSLVGVQMSC